MLFSFQVIRESRDWAGSPFFMDYLLLLFTSLYYLPHLYKITPIIFTNIFSLKKTRRGLIWITTWETRLFALKPVGNTKNTPTSMGLNLEHNSHTLIRKINCDYLLLVMFFKKLIINKTTYIFLLLMFIKTPKMFWTDTLILFANMFCVLNYNLNCFMLPYNRVFITFK